MKLAYSDFVHVTIVTLVACCCGDFQRARCAEQKGADRPVVVEKLPPDVRSLIEQMEADERVLTIREVNLFHRHFIETCMEVMPQDVTFGYNGVLATDSGRQPLRLYFDDAVNLGLPLHWGVGRDLLAVFRFWISTRATKQTLAKCNIEGRELFVNVDFVTKNQRVDAKLPELGGRSVREVLKHIEKPGPKPGPPEKKTPSRKLE